MTTRFVSMAMGGRRLSLMLLRAGRVGIGGGRIPEERVVLWGGIALRNEVDLLFGFQGPSNCRSVGVHLALTSKTESSSSNRDTREERGRSPWDIGSRG
jgi:hypothetical protein